MASCPCANPGTPHALTSAGAVRQTWTVRDAAKFPASIAGASYVCVSPLHGFHRHSSLALLEAAHVSATGGSHLYALWSDDVISTQDVNVIDTQANTVGLMVRYPFT